MILTCPSCGTQYVVKDGAIPPEGRQVRCAACKHSWHQDPEGAASAEPEPEAGAEEEMLADAPQRDAAVKEEDEDESLAEATMIEPRSGPAAEERAYEETLVENEGDTPAADETEAAADWAEPPHAEAAPDTFSPFAENGEVEPRRRGPLVTIILIALIIVAAAAAFWFLAPPDLKARLGLAATGTSPLALVITHRDRQQLESGNQLLTVTGRVINPTTKEQLVPPLQAQLLGPSGKVVYSWTIEPPARSLAAGASASFNSAEVNVPPGGDDLRITVGQPKA
ncbi:MAG: zinc-ribbon domain-containing protein [Sphingomicrobium sp.]